MRVLGNLCRVVVTDVRIQSGHQHERVPQMMLDLFAIDAQARNAVLDKTVTRVVNQTNRVQQIVNHYRLKDIQFKVAL